MADASWPLQQALYQHLSADTALQALIGNPPRLADGTPDDPVYPFLTIGAARQRDWPGVENGQSHELTIHAWSRHGGRRELKQLMDAVSMALADATLTINGHRLVLINYVFADAFRQADNETWHGVMRFRALTHPE